MDSNTDNNRHIVVIGGGAAGMMAAIAAARDGKRCGVRVTIIEKDDRLGKKILVTGNGHCNLSNELINRKRGFYEYRNREFAAHVLNIMDYKRIMAYFEFLGLMVSSDDRGWVFPMTNWANSVLDVLLNEIKRRGINYILGTAVTGITPVSTHTSLLAPVTTTADISSRAFAQAPDTITADTATHTSLLAPVTTSTREPESEPLPHKGRYAGDRYRVTLEDGREIIADALIIATGNSKLKEGLERQPFNGFSPILAPLPTETAPLKGLDGVRCKCNVTLYRNKQTVCAEYGDVLFRDYGLSGIAIFNLSRFAKPSDVLALDFLPEYSHGKLTNYLSYRLFTLGKVMPSALTDVTEHTAQEFLVGVLHNRVAMAVLRSMNVEPTAYLDEESIKPLVKRIKAYKLEVTGAPLRQQAQATRGGFMVEGFHPKTLESRIYPNVYAAGEVLDVDGPCGGFNLHWAWASGIVAGEHAAACAV